MAGTLKKGLTALLTAAAILASNVAHTQEIDYSSLCNHLERSGIEHLDEDGRQGYQKMCGSKAQIEPKPVEQPEAPAVTQPTAPAQPTRSQERIKLEQEIQTITEPYTSQDERFSGIALDLTPNKGNGEVLYSFNPNAKVQAASMVKPYIAAQFLQRVEDGTLTYGPKSRTNLEKSLTSSENPASNFLMRWAAHPEKTPEEFEKRLKANFGNLLKDTEVPVFIPSVGRSEDHYKNKTSPADAARFLRALHRGELPKNEELKKYMGPGNSHLICKPNFPEHRCKPKNIPRGIKTFNKTGLTRQSVGDMALMVPVDKEGNERPYIVVGMFDRDYRCIKNGKKITDVNTQCPGNTNTYGTPRARALGEISDKVYELMQQRYNLPDEQPGRALQRIVQEQPVQREVQEPSRVETETVTETSQPVLEPAAYQPPREVPSPKGKMPKGVKVSFPGLEGQVKILAGDLDGDKQKRDTRYLVKPGYRGSVVVQSKVPIDGFTLSGMGTCADARKGDYPENKEKFVYFKSSKPKFDMELGKPNWYALQVEFKNGDFHKFFINTKDKATNCQ